jgi:hypothetical protein
MNQPEARQSLSVRERTPWAIVRAALVSTPYYLALFARRLAEGVRFLRDLMHDGRRVLAAPCH